MAADEFADPTNPETMAPIDYQASFRNFERLLTAELKRFYPAAEITVRISDFKQTAIYLDQEDIAWTGHPAAATVDAGIRTAMDKLFFEGRFWVDRQL
jgi:hypothetical protein